MPGGSDFFYFKNKIPGIICPEKTSNRALHIFIIDDSKHQQCSPVLAFCAFKFAVLFMPISVNKDDRVIVHCVVITYGDDLH